MSSDNRSNETSTWDDPRITAYLMGELPDEARLLFEQEMKSSPELAAAVDEGRNVIGELKDFYLAGSDATGGLDESRRAAIVDADTVSVPPSRNWFTRHWLEIVVAASLVGVLAGLMLPSVQSAREAARRPVAMDTDALPIEQVQKPVEDEMSSEKDFKRIYAPKESSANEQLSLGKQVLIEATGRADDPKATSGPQPFYGQADSDLTSDLAFAPMQETSSNSARSSGRSLQRSAPGKSSAMSLGVEEVEPMDGYGEMSGGYGGGSPYDSSGKLEAKKPKPMPMDMYGGEMDMDGDDMNAGYGLAMEGMESDREAKADEAVNLVPELGTIVIKGEKKDVARTRRMIEAINTDNESLNRFGTGPGASGDKYDSITDNPFKRVSEHPLSTFSIDVDTAAYSKVRRSLKMNRLPPPSAVRIEEMINYFDYHYDGPGENSEHPFANEVAVMDCPWNENNLLARIAIKGRDLDRESRPKCNLVFLLDTSGSMNQPSKLPLVVDGMKMLLKQLRPDDKVAIVTYAGSAGLVLDSTKASKKKKIRRALTQLSAGGSTNGGQGIQLAYDTARDNFIDGGVNRIILCSDGDFNVGRTSTGDLVSMVETESKGGIFLTVLGFGMGNHNDAMMEQISGRGNGNYAYIDTIEEAHKVFVNQTAGTLVTIAKDVKLQLEFNPNEVAAYRLIGYENRVLAKEDFNDDKKDAGEIGAGHNVTALYEIVPAGSDADALAPGVDPLKYQSGSEVTEAAASGDLLTLKLRYKQPNGDVSTLIETPVKTEIKTSFAKADLNTRFSVAVAGLGMQLRSSPYKGNWTPADVVSTAENAIGQDDYGLRQEFISLAKKAAKLLTSE